MGFTAQSLAAEGPRAHVQEPTYFTGSEVRIRDPDLPTLQFAVAFKGASWTDPDSLPLMIMQQMLGSWNKHSGVADTGSSGELPPPLIPHTLPEPLFLWRQLLQRASSLMLEWRQPLMEFGKCQQGG